MAVNTAKVEGRRKLDYASLAELLAAGPVEVWLLDTGYWSKPNALALATARVRFVVFSLRDMDAK